MTNRTVRSILGLCALLLVSCGRPTPASEPSASTIEPEAPATTARVWPSGLRPFGDGFPNPGDPCRRLGESDLSIDLLDDSAVLVGCPGAATDSAAAAIVSSLGGQVVGAAGGQADAVTLISVPQRDSNAGIRTNPEPGPPDNSEANARP